jgi:hypothetical protein
VTGGAFNFAPSQGAAHHHLVRKAEPKAPPMGKASGTGHPKFTICTQSECTGVVSDRGAETILGNAKGRATRPDGPAVHFQISFKGGRRTIILTMVTDHGIN